LTCAPARSMLKDVNPLKVGGTTKVRVAPRTTLHDHEPESSAARIDGWPAWAGLFSCAVGMPARQDTTGHGEARPSGVLKIVSFGRTLQ